MEAGEAGFRCAHVGGLVWDSSSSGCGHGAGDSGSGAVAASTLARSKVLGRSLVRVACLRPHHLRLGRRWQHHRTSANTCRCLESDRVLASPAVNSLRVAASNGILALSRSPRW